MGIGKQRNDCKKGRSEEIIICSVLSSRTQHALHIDSTLSAPACQTITNFEFEHFQALACFLPGIFAVACDASLWDCRYT
jgi:hypothetical protein